MVKSFAKNVKHFEKMAESDNSALPIRRRQLGAAASAPSQFGAADSAPANSAP